MRTEMDKCHNDSEFEHYLATAVESRWEELKQDYQQLGVDFSRAIDFPSKVIPLLLSIGSNKEESDIILDLVFNQIEISSRGRHTGFFHLSTPNVFVGTKAALDFARSISVESTIPLKQQVSENETLRSNIASSITAINDEWIKYLAKHPNLLYQISPRRFEELIAELLTDMGYHDVRLTPETRDKGRDILAVLNTPIGEMLTIVECKRYSPERKIGLDIVERFLWVLEHEDVASCALLATTSYFSKEASMKANQYRWRLILKDFTSIQEWLNQYGRWAQKSDSGIWIPTLSLKRM